MKQKIIFIDVDGTLVNDNDIVPDSAAAAIKKARKNGHYVFYVQAVQRQNYLLI